MGELKMSTFKVKMMSESAKPEGTSELSSNYTGRVVISKQFKDVTVVAPTVCEAYVIAKKTAGDAGDWTPIGFEIVK